jgi:transcriptional regulator with XRE-family HTH domain
MKARSLTQVKFGEMTGLRQSHISKLVNGRSTPTLETASKIAAALRVTIEEVWPQERGRA